MSLAMLYIVRYAPHVGRNLSQPRAPAIIERYLAYMNPLGAFVRGGDIWIRKSTWVQLLSFNADLTRFIKTATRRAPIGGAGKTSRH